MREDGPTDVELMVEGSGGRTLGKGMWTYEGWKRRMSMSEEVRALRRLWLREFRRGMNDEGTY